MDRTYATYTAAHHRFIWWLVGIGYSLYCLFGPLLPTDLGAEALIFLTARGAGLGLLICVIGAAEGWRQRKITWRHHSAMLNAWLAEQPRAKT